MGDFRTSNQWPTLQVVFAEAHQRNITPSVGYRDVVRTCCTPRNNQTQTAIELWQVQLVYGVRGRSAVLRATRSLILRSRARTLKRARHSIFMSRLTGTPLFGVVINQTRQPDRTTTVVAVDSSAACASFPPPGCSIYCRPHATAAATKFVRYPLSFLYRSRRCCVPRWSWRSTAHSQQ